LKQRKIAGKINVSPVFIKNTASGVSFPKTVFFKNVQLGKFANLLLPFAT
jgi:hypothetical protein